MGLLLRNSAGQLVFRHASRAHGRVLEVPFAAYLAQLEQNETAWPVVGLIVLEVAAAKGPDAN